MKYTKDTASICLADIKQAALFFDRVFPFEQNEFVNMETLKKDKEGKLLHKKYEFKSEIHKQVFFDLITGTTTPSNEQYKKIITMYSQWRILLLGVYAEVKKEFISNTLQKYIYIKSPLEIADIIIQNMENIDITQELSDLYISNVSIPLNDDVIIFRDVFINPIKSLNIINPSIVLPSRYINHIDPASDDVTLTLSNIQLIDTSKISWEQIYEIRKDPHATRNLRNLKLFIYSNYSDKPKSFIEDDIIRRIDDYHKTCKDYGLQLSLSALSTTLNSKNILASVAAGISTAFLCGPLVGIGAAVVIEIGNLTIEIAKGYQAFTKLKNDHPLAYIIDVKKKANQINKQ